MKYFSSAQAIISVALKNNFKTLIFKSGQFFKLTRTFASNVAYKTMKPQKLLFIRTSFLENTAKHSRVGSNKNCQKALCQRHNELSDGNNTGNNFKIMECKGLPILYSTPDHSINENVSKPKSESFVLFLGHFQRLPWDPETPLSTLNNQRSTD